MKNNMPFGPASPETVILKLKPDNAPSARAQFLDRISRLFEYLNWRAHVYILNGDPANRLEGFWEIAQLAQKYLAQQKFCTLYIHPVFVADDFSAASIAVWDGILSLPVEFQQEAYREQGKERLIILPVLKFAASADADSVTAAARFFQNRLVKPSLYFAAEPPFDCVPVLGRDVRVYVDAFSHLSDESVLVQLGSNHIFEDLLERVGGSPQDMLLPCRRHLVIDEADLSVFACFRQFQKGISCGTFESLFEGLVTIDAAQCVDCIPDSLSLMGDNFRVNRRLGEGAQVCLDLGHALVDRGLFREAVAHFERGFEFSSDDEGRAIALLNQGLCYLSLVEFQQADRALREGVKYTADPNGFIYHRGRVLMAWQDYPGAITLFETVLSDVPEGIPKDDLLLNLVVSYINLDDVASASKYLGMIEFLSSPVCYYQGVCRFASGQVEASLECFRQALQMGPAPEDLSRVLFYCGTCLKELGRYDEAIKMLHEAVAADPSEYLNHNLLGFCFFQLKEHQKSIEAFKRAIEINPRSAIDYASIGSNLRQLGSIEEAVAMYRMALSIDPSLTFAAENIARLSEVSNG